MPYCIPSQSRFQTRHKYFLKKNEEINNPAIAQNGNNPQCV